MAVFRLGLFLALDSSYWNHLLSQLGTRPTEWEGGIPGTAGYTAPPTPPPRNRSSTSPPSTPPPSPVASPPQRQRPSSPPRAYVYSAEWNFDPGGVGKNRKDSFGILELPLTATEREIKVQYRRLARIYHPDRYELASNEVSSRMTMLEAQQHFQMINNAYEYVRNQ